eukprot:1153119-Pelagomonas_calceolata.AAC.6
MFRGIVSEKGDARLAPGGEGQLQALILNALLKDWLDDLCLTALELSGRGPVKLSQLLLDYSTVLPVVVVEGRARVTAIEGALWDLREAYELKLENASIQLKATQDYGRVTSLRSPLSLDCGCGIPVCMMSAQSKSGLNQEQALEWAAVQVYCEVQQLKTSSGPASQVSRERPDHSCPMVVDLCKPSLEACRH